MFRILKMTTLQERLREVMERYGIPDQKRLADFCEVSEGLVAQWFSGQTGLGPKPLRAFGRKTDYSLDWLSEGILPKLKKEKSRVETLVQPNNVHPAISEVTRLMQTMDEAGKWRLVERAKVIAEQHPVKVNDAAS